MLSGTRLLLLAPFFLCSGCACTSEVAVVRPESASGVKQAQVKVPVDSEGHTTEQRNIIERLKRDNEPGSIKHLYVISTYSGQVLLYSAVRGKVTSSSKRLTPTTVHAGYFEDSHGWPKPSGSQVNIGGKEHLTSEVLQDDGTYGSSIEYLYWFTPDGRFHQHYLSGGQIVHVADQPVSVKGVVINLQEAKPE